VLLGGHGTAQEFPGHHAAPDQISDAAGLNVVVEPLGAAREREKLFQLEVVGQHRHQAEPEGLQKSPFFILTQRWFLKLSVQVIILEVIN